MQEVVNVIGDLYEDNGYGSAAGRIYDSNGVCPTLGAAHFSQIKYIAEVVAIKLKHIKSLTEQNRTEQNRTEPHNARMDKDMDDEKYEHCKSEPWTWEIDGELYRIRIRKLTPKECWRLMDFSDRDFSKAAEVNSNTQLYKQAGNSIVKNVLVAAMGQLIPGKEDFYKYVQR